MGGWREGGGGGGGRVGGLVQEVEVERGLMMEEVVVLVMTS